MKAIFRRELRACWRSGAGFLFLGLIVLGFGAGAIWHNLLTGYANVSMAMQYAAYALIPASSFLTMHAFAAEKRRHTDRLLYALPLADWKLALAKYLARLAPLAAAAALLFACTLCMRLLGPIPIALAAGELAYFLALGALMIAMGLFMAALSARAAAAMLGNAAFWLLCLFAGDLSDWVAGVGAVSYSGLIVVGALAIALGYLFTRNATCALLAALLALAGMLLAKTLGGGALADALLMRALARLEVYGALRDFQAGKLDLVAIFRALIGAGLLVFFAVRAVALRKMGLGGTGK